VKLLIGFLLSLFLFNPLLAEAGIKLSGEYKLVGHIYKGVEIPLMNPNLNMRLTFFENGTDRLYWDRIGEHGFCERFSNYKIENGHISESVYAVNPNNSFECTKDPDMNVGRKTTSKIDINDQRILLYLQLSDEEFVYIFKEIK